MRVIHGSQWCLDGSNLCRPIPIKPTSRALVLPLGAPIGPNTILEVAPKFLDRLGNICPVIAHSVAFGISGQCISISNYNYVQKLEATIVCSKKIQCGIMREHTYRHNRSWKDHCSTTKKPHSCHRLWEDRSIVHIDSRLGIASMYCQRQSRTSVCC